MTHFKKYWLWYLIAIIVVVAAILVYSNWETVKGWFSSSENSSENNLGSTDRVTEELSSSNQININTQRVRWIKCEGSNNYGFGTNVWVSVIVNSKDCKSNETYAAKQFLNNYKNNTMSTNNCKVNKNNAIAFQQQLDAKLTSQFPNLHFVYYMTSPSNCS